MENTRLSAGKPLLSETEPTRVQPEGTADFLKVSNAAASSQPSVTESTKKHHRVKHTVGVSKFHIDNVGRNSTKNSGSNACALSTPVKTEPNTDEGPWLTNLVQRGIEYGLNFDADCFTLDATDVLIDETLSSHANISPESNLQIPLLNDSNQEGCVTIDGFDFRTFETQPESFNVLQDDLMQELIENEYRTSAQDKIVPPVNNLQINLSQNVIEDNSNLNQGQSISLPVDARSKLSTKSRIQSRKSLPVPFKKTASTDSITPSKTADVTKIKGWKKKTFARVDQSVLKVKKESPGAAKDSSRTPVEIVYDDSFINSHDITIEDEGPNINLEMYDHVDITPWKMDEPEITIKKEVENLPDELAPIEIDHNIDYAPKVVPKNRSRPRLVVASKQKKSAPQVVPPFRLPKLPPVSTKKLPSLTVKQSCELPISPPPASSQLTPLQDATSEQLAVRTYKPKTKAELRQYLEQVELGKRNSAPKLQKQQAKQPNHPEHLQSRTKNRTKMVAELDVNYMYVWKEGRPIKIRGSKGIVCNIAKKAAIPPKKTAVKRNPPATVTSPKTLIPEPAHKNIIKPKKFSIMQSCYNDNLASINTQRETPKPRISVFGLQLYPSTTHCLSPVAVHQLKLLRSDKDSYDINWNNFCVSNVTKDERVNLLPHEVVLPVKLTSTPEGGASYEPAERPVYISSHEVTSHVDNFNPLDDLSIATSDLPSSVLKTMYTPTKDLEIISDVKKILNEMVHSVELSDDINSICETDPDTIITAENSQPNNLIQPVVSSEKVRSTRKKGSPLHCELKRLKVIVIEESELPSSLAVNGASSSVCNNAYCRLGCVCNSSKNNQEQLHCGREECMFACSCNFQPVSNSSMLSADVVTKINENLQNLAKTEKEFQQTVVRGKDDLLVVEGCSTSTQGRRKREVKLPQRYRTDTLMSDKEFDQAETIEEKYKTAPVPVKTNTPVQTQIRVMASALSVYVPKHVKEKRQNQLPQEFKRLETGHDGQATNLKPCHVVMFKAIGLENVVHFCMIHHQYDCICLKLGTVNSSFSAAPLYPSIERNRQPAKSRNVAVKRTHPLAHIPCARSCKPKINYLARNKGVEHGIKLLNFLAGQRSLTEVPELHSAIPTLRSHTDSTLPDLNSTRQPSSLSSVPVTSVPAVTVPSSSTCAETKLNPRMRKSRKLDDSILANKNTISNVSVTSELSVNESVPNSQADETTDIVCETIVTPSVPALSCHGGSNTSLLTAVHKSCKVKAETFGSKPDKNLLCFEALPAEDAIIQNLQAASKPGFQSLISNRLLKWSLLQEQFRSKKIHLWIKPTYSRKRLLVTEDDKAPDSTCRNLREYCAETVTKIPHFIMELLDPTVKPSDYQERYALLKSLGSLMEVCAIKKMQNIYKRSHAIYKVPLPKCNAACRWFVVNMDLTFEKLQCFGCVVTYRQLILLAQGANIRKKVNAMLFKNNFKTNYQNETDFPLIFGLYALPKLGKKIFLGPFSLLNTDPVKLYTKGPVLRNRTEKSVPQVASFVELQNGDVGQVCWLFTEASNVAKQKRANLRPYEPYEVEAKMSKKVGAPKKVPVARPKPAVKRFVPILPKATIDVQPPEEGSLSFSNSEESVDANRLIQAEKFIQADTESSLTDHTIRIKFIPTIPSLGYIEGKYMANGKFKFPLLGFPDSEISLESVQEVNKYLHSLLSQRMKVPRGLAVNWYPKPYDYAVQNCLPMDPRILNGRYTLTERGVFASDSPPLTLKSRNRSAIIRGLSELGRVLGVDKKLSARSILLLAVQEATSAAQRERSLCDERAALKDQKLALVKKFDEVMTRVRIPELRSHLTETLREILTSRTTKVTDAVIDVNSDSDWDDGYSDDDSLFDEDETEHVVDLTSSDDPALSPVLVTNNLGNFGSLEVETRVKARVSAVAEPGSASLGMKRPSVGEVPQGRMKRRRKEGSNGKEIPLLDITEEAEGSEVEHNTKDLPPCVRTPPATAVEGIQQDIQVASTSKQPDEMRDMKVAPQLGKMVTLNENETKGTTYMIMPGTNGKQYCVQLAPSPNPAALPPTKSNSHLSILGANSALSQLAKDGGPRQFRIVSGETINKYMNASSLGGVQNSVTFFPETKLKLSTSPKLVSIICPKKQDAVEMGVKPLTGHPVPVRRRQVRSIKKPHATPVGPNVVTIQAPPFTTADCAVTIQTPQTSTVGQPNAMTRTPPKTSAAETASHQTLSAQNCGPTTLKIVRINSAVPSNSQPSQLVNKSALVLEQQRLPQSGTTVGNKPTQLIHIRPPKNPANSASNPLRTFSGTVRLQMDPRIRLSRPQAPFRLNILRPRSNPVTMLRPRMLQSLVPQSKVRFSSPSAPRLVQLAMMPQSPTAAPTHLAVPTSSPKQTATVLTSVASLPIVTSAVTNTESTIDDDIDSMSHIHQ